MDSFDPTEIEQMKPEFEECKWCGGTGTLEGRINDTTQECYKCWGTGQIVKEES